MQTACARAGEVLAGPPLDNGNVHARQRQLARQHQPRRTSPGDHNRMLGHHHAPAGMTPVATSASHPSAAAPSARDCTASPTIGSASARDPYVDNNTCISPLPFPQVLASADDYAARPGAGRNPPVRDKMKMERSG